MCELCIWLYLVCFVICWYIVLNIILRERQCLRWWLHFTKVLLQSSFKVNSATFLADLLEHFGEGMKGTVSDAEFEWYSLHIQVLSNNKPNAYETKHTMYTTCMTMRNNEKIIKHPKRLKRTEVDVLLCFPLKLSRICLYNTHVLFCFVCLFVGVFVCLFQWNKTLYSWLRW